MLVSKAQFYFWTLSVPNRLVWPIGTNFTKLLLSDTSRLRFGGAEFFHNFIRTSFALLRLKSRLDKHYYALWDYEVLKHYIMQLSCSDYCFVVFLNRLFNAPLIPEQIPKRHCF